MTTLNAKANAAYQDLIAKTERENPGDVWAGFDGDQDAFETGWETGHEAAQSGLAPLLGQLSDALLIVDGYDVMEGDVVPERELWPVINAARKVLEGAAPQPMDRESLEKAIEQAASDVDLAKYFLPGTTDCFVDAVLALLNGTAK